MGVIGCSPAPPGRWGRGSSSWEELVVGRDRGQGPGVRWEAGDDRGRVGEAALGQADNSLLTVFRAQRADGPRWPHRGARAVGGGGVAAGLDGDDVGADRARRSGRADPCDHRSVGMLRWSRRTSISSRVPSASPLTLRASAQNASCAAVNVPAARLGPGRWSREERRAWCAGPRGSGPGRDGARCGRRPGVDRDDGAAVEDDDLGGAQRDPDPAPDQVRRDGVLHHPHGDHRGAVHPRVQHRARVEPLDRQRVPAGVAPARTLRRPARPGR
jgi:hypothetical protein